MSHNDRHNQPFSRHIEKALRRVRTLAIPRIRRTKIGASPGIEPHELTSHYTPDPSDAKAVVTCVDYNTEQVEFQQVHDLDAFVNAHRPEWAKVRWINIDNLTDLPTIQAIATKYKLHPLAIEDVLHVPQRPKVDRYDSQDGLAPRLFIIARAARLIDNHYHSEQVSIFLGHQTVITIQQAPSDIWKPLHQRLARQSSRIRQHPADFLTYCILDAMVDNLFPILEEYGNQLETLEDRILADPQPGVIHAVHTLKRQLLMIRRDVWPMREMLQALQREPHECLSSNTHTYLRDVYDHAVQIIDLLETYREVSSGLSDMYMSSMSQRMNEVMKVLTIMGTIFIPMTFLAGVYGMNFKHMPELEWPIGYLLFWLICFFTAAVMIYWFRKRKWL